MRLDKTELILLGVAVLLAAAGLIAPQWLVFLLTMALAKSMVVQGVVMQMRAGLVTFGQGLYFCIGGFAVGMSGHFLAISDLPTLLLIGVAAAVALAMLLGLLMTRYREIFFAMLSLAFSMILYGMLVKSPALGSTDGFNVKPWTLFGWSPAAGQAPLALFVIIVAVTAVLAVLLHRYGRSSAGAMCEAIRENEVRVEYLGQSPRWVLYMNYVAAAGVSALGGGFMALAAGHIDPEMAYWITSGEFVFIALLGGTAHVAAPIIAAILFAVVRTYAIELVPHSWQMILGVTLLAIIIFLPKGLWSLFGGQARATKAVEAKA